MSYFPERRRLRRIAHLQSIIDWQYVAILALAGALVVLAVWALAQIYERDTQIRDLQIELAQYEEVQDEQEE